MALDREAIYEALNTRLQSVQGLVTPCSRFFKVADDVPAAEQPVMFLTADGEKASGDKRQPLKWTLTAHIWIYSRHDADPSIAPSTIQNQLMQAVEAAMEAQPGEVDHGPFTQYPDQPYTTLGGLVDCCRIFGEVVKDEGLFQGQGVMVIPVEITTTA